MKSYHKAMLFIIAIQTNNAWGRQDEPAGERLAWSIVPEVVRISETVSSGRSGEDGFGLVVGERNSQIFIVTADHVVRSNDSQPYGSVQVTFKAEQGEPHDARLLDLRIPPRHGDLAVLELQKPSGLILTWPAAADMAHLVEGTRAWRVGKQERWTPSVNPGEYVGLQQTIWLAFDGLDTPPGSSGGPVVTADGIIGLVVADGGSSGEANAVLPIDTIERQLRLWDVPWNLTHAIPQTAQRPSLEQAPPATALITLVPQAPSPSVSAPRSLAELARIFILQYYASLSQDASVILTRLPLEIADPIRFFGKWTSLSQYLNTQERYFRRWPERRFQLRPNKLDVQCTSAEPVCAVTGTVDYDLHDPARSC